MSHGSTDAAKFELIGRISAGLAHELNGPIGIALGFTELATELLDGAGDGDLPEESVAKLRQYMGLIDSAGARARALSRQIWSFAKSEPGVTSDLDFDALFEEAAALAGPALKVAQVEVQRRNDNEASARADRAICLQSLVQFLLEAPTALPGGGSVFWEVSPGKEGQASFTVVAEPWGEAESAEWPIHDSVAKSFEQQGGLIRIASPRQAETAGAEAVARVVEGWLPGISGS